MIGQRNGRSQIRWSTPTTKSTTMSTISTRNILRFSRLTTKNSKPRDPYLWQWQSFLSQPWDRQGLSVPDQPVRLSNRLEPRWASRRKRSNQLYTEHQQPNCSPSRTSRRWGWSRNRDWYRHIPCDRKSCYPEKCGDRLWIEFCYQWFG